MKKSIVFLPLMLIVAYGACSRLTDFVPGGNAITPSDTIITEQRDVSGFTGIDMGTFGKVVITQGDDQIVDHQGQ